MTPDRSPFKAPLTFLDLPLSRSFRDADIALLGIPYDCARDMIRFGSRLGPNAVRHASVLTAKLIRDAEPSPLVSHRVVDAGNVDLNLEDINEAFDAIESAMDEILSGDCIPVTVGGDGAVSLPQMRALHRKHGPFALVHVDAHTDAWPVSPDNPYTNANQFTHAVNEGLLDMSAAMHIGTRGPVNANAAILHARDMGYHVIPMEELLAVGIEQTAETVRQRIDGRPLFICYDMDFFDPAMVPGVATPTPGGASPVQGIELMRMLSGHNVIGLDINTTTPIHDPAGASANLAASLLAEGLAII